MIVVDANILAFYVIEGRRTSQARTLRERDAEWLVPAFWRIEFQSILWKYARFGGLSDDTALRLFDRAIALFSPNETGPVSETVLQDALDWQISVYDAQYVSLAKRCGVLCVTEDKAVQQACPDLTISLDDFIKRASGGSLVREHKAIDGMRRPSRTRAR